MLTLITNANLVDSHRDGLNDKWEVTYNGSSGVNPLVDYRSNLIFTHTLNLVSLKNSRESVRPPMDDSSPYSQINTFILRLKELFQSPTIYPPHSYSLYG